MPPNTLQNQARHRVGLILTLVGLIVLATLWLDPSRRGLAQATASWSYTGNLSTARVGHTATLLLNGKVLVAGGSRNGSFDFPAEFFSSAELYDPTTGTWSSTGNLNTARADHTATLLPDGKVLVAGGGYGTFGEFDTAELYDPATGTWSYTGSLVAPSSHRDAARANHTATLLQNGKVLVAGGTNGYGDGETNGAALYDPASGTWSIAANLNSRRYGHTATLLPGGKVLVAGGYMHVFSGDGTLNSAELFDPATETWSSTGNLNTARSGATSTLLPNGKVLVDGGLNNSGEGLNSAEIYNPATGTWTMTTSPNTTCSYHTATLLPNGKVLVAGGGTGKSAQLYDPATGTWSVTADLNTERGSHTATLLPNGKVLVAGGGYINGISQSSAELYDPGASSTPNQIDETQFFVSQHYRDFLNREPDSSGLSFWMGQISQCGTSVGCIEAMRVNTSASFFLSIEFQESGYLVYRFYKSAFGNLPNAPVPVRLSDFLPDAQQIGQGVIVGQTGWPTVMENNKQAYANAFVQRSQFTTAFPTSMSSGTFVDTLFANAGVTPASADRSAAIAEFGTATTTADTAARARALRRVAENSTLAQQEFNRAFVLMQYFGYLRRNPNDAPETTLDFQGYNFWLNKLNQFNGNYIQAEMVKAFLSSIEYRQRFGQP